MVTQRGRRRADKFRFDFAYHEPLARAAGEIEELVTEDSREPPVERSRQPSTRGIGGGALFGEKIRRLRRVVEIDDFSRELVEALTSARPAR